MSGRGRRAALPEAGHRRPAVSEGAGLVVRHVSENGASERAYDFGSLPVTEDLQRALAAVFAHRAGPDGTWRTIDSSREGWVLFAKFARFLAELDRPPRTLAELTPGCWVAWKLSRPLTNRGSRHLSGLANLLGDHPEIPAVTRSLMKQRSLLRPRPSEAAYSKEDYGAIKTAAQRDLRQALERIRRGTQHLGDWRDGKFEQGSRDWLIGEALEVLAATGDVPFYYGDARHGRRVVSRYLKVLGGSSSVKTWQRLFLSSNEAVSLVALLVAEQGWNATSAAEVRIPVHHPDSGADGSRTYTLELEKRRRGQPTRFETRNLTDWGAGSPGRLITSILEVTAPARALLLREGLPSDRLVISRLFKLNGKHDPLQMFRSGQLVPTAVQDWGRTMGLDFPLNLRRLRKTAVAQHRRTPVQHSQDVHDRVYVLSDPQTAERVVPVIQQGLQGALDHVARTFVARRGPEPETGDDTATACCTDYRNSPFGTPGQPCRASFLLCLACPNAVVAPRHLPRLTYLHQALESLRAVLPTGVWESDWREHHERLADLKQQHCTEAEWRDALEAVDRADRDAIDSLLNRGFES
ncbi:hypothetical protein [Glycomyces sp. MUSA5-2]|uniref:hypothetical protein n=1 Tax=Glycomyces sp. MUSA5-2 TaxID=2053002 RepID=UPI00300B0343